MAGFPSDVEIFKLQIRMEIFKPSTINNLWPISMTQYHIFMAKYGYGHYGSPIPD